MQIKAFGYRIGQGYKYGKPMAEEAFLAHMAAWQPEQCPCPGGDVTAMATSPRPT
jgi:hypothetical protein